MGFHGSCNSMYLVSLRPSQVGHLLLIESHTWPQLLHNSYVHLADPLMDSQHQDRLEVPTHS